jgi:hypothetical protein
MFNIFHKRSKIVVDAFTCEPAVYEFFQIERGTKHIPEWFKKMPREFESDKDTFKVKTPTMKGCVAITDTFKQSYIIQNWQEIMLRAVDGKFEWTTPLEESLNIHPFGDMQKSSEFMEVSHIKIDTPWLMREKTGVNFLLSDTFWNNYDHHKKFHYKIVPGMIQFKTQSSLNINIVAKKNVPDFSIVAGEPIAQLFPMSDSNIEFKHHLVSKEEWIRIHQTYAYPHSFAHKAIVNDRLRKWKNRS